MIEYRETNNNNVSNLVQFPLFQPEALPPVTPKPAAKPAPASTKKRIIKFAVPKPKVTRTDLERREDTAALFDRVEISFVDALAIRQEQQRIENAIEDGDPQGNSKAVLGEHLNTASTRFDAIMGVLFKHWNSAKLGGISEETLLEGIVHRIIETDGLLCPDFKESK